MVSKILAFQNPPHNRLYMKQSTKMHWYDHNNTIALLNIAKSQIFHLVLYNFKIVKLNTILPACQPASQPAITPSSTSAMAPDFS